MYASAVHDFTVIRFALRNSGFNVKGVHMVAPHFVDNADGEITTHSHQPHMFVGICLIVGLVLGQKKRIANRQLAKLRDRQRRRRTDMVDGIDGQEMGWAYHDNSGESDVDGVDTDDRLESQPLRGESVRRRSSA